MNYGAKGKPYELVKVPPEVRAKFLQLGDGSVSKARVLCGVSEQNATEIAGPNGVVRRKTLNRVIAKIDEASRG